MTEASTKHYHGLAARWRAYEDASMLKGDEASEMGWSVAHDLTAAELADLLAWVRREMDAAIRANLMVHGDTPKIAGPFEHDGRVEFVVTQRGPAPDPEVLALHIMAALGWSTDAGGLDLARRLCAEARAAP